MKKLETAFIYTTIILSVVEESLSFGSQLVIQREVSKRSALFQKVKDGEVLEGHVIANYSVPSELDCLHRCVSRGNCVSFNYQRLSFESSRHSCELNDVTLLSSGEKLVRRNGYSYKEPIVLPYDGDKNETIGGGDLHLTMTSPIKETSLLSSMTASSAIVTSKSSILTLSKTSPNVLATSSNMPSSLSSTIKLSKTSSPVLSSIASSNVPAASSVILSALTFLPSSHLSVTQSSCRIPVTSPPFVLNSTLVVMTSSVTLLSTSVKPQTDCGNGWHRYRTGCIRFFTESKQRVMANSHCKLFKTSNGKKGCMIKIPSIEDNDKVVSLAPQNGRYYIGLTDQDQEGVYRWKGTTDDATYFNWQLGYPHGINIEENRDCTVISTHPDNSYGKWSTVPCSNSWFYICECESACS